MLANQILLFYFLQKTFSFSFSLHSYSVRLSPSFEFIPKLSKPQMKHIALSLEASNQKSRRFEDSLLYVLKPDGVTLPPATCYTVYIDNQWWGSKCSLELDPESQCAVLGSRSILMCIQFINSRCVALSKENKIVNIVENSDSMEDFLKGYQQHLKEKHSEFAFPNEWTVKFHTNYEEKFRDLLHHFNLRIKKQNLKKA